MLQCWLLQNGLRGLSRRGDRVGGVGPGAGRIGCTGPESGNLEDWAIAMVQELGMVRYALVQIPRYGLGF